MVKPEWLQKSLGSLDFLGMRARNLWSSYEKHIEASKLRWNFGKFLIETSKRFN